MIHVSELPPKHRIAIACEPVVQELLRAGYAAHAATATAEAKADETRKDQDHEQAKD